MKKKMISVVTTIMAFILAMSVFAGCDLITVNNTRDMNQVVATVKTDQDAPEEKIYKKDMVWAYISYGYVYVQNYGYTQAATFQLIFDNLVESRILVQEACRVFNEKENKNLTGAELYNAENYLDEEEKAEALYNTIYSINSLIDGFENVEEEEEEPAEETTEETRTAPTDAKNYEKELGLEDWNEYIAKGIRTDEDEDGNPSVTRKNAYNKTLKFLQGESLLGEGFDLTKGDITESEFYQSTLKSNYERFLVDNYENSIRDDVMSKLSAQTLADNYAEMYEAQKNGTVSQSDYETSLSEASLTNPVVYNPYSGYGYVYNLLLSIDDYQTAEIEAIDSTDKAEILRERNAILSKTTVTDLRSTWITAGYDFDYETLSFTGDYAKAEKALPFQGSVTWLNEADKPADDKDDEDYTAKYEINSVRRFGLDEFIAFMDEYLYDGPVTGNKTEKYYREVVNPVAEENSKEFRNRVQDLLFAFSGDPGSLNTYQGYVIYPKARYNETDKYVAEFTEAAIELVANGKLGDYKIVGTEFGYHIMFYSDTVTVNSGYPTLWEYLVAMGEADGFDSLEAYYADMLANIDDYADKESYLYTLQQAYVSTIVTNQLNEAREAIIQSFQDEDGEYVAEKGVTVYKGRFSDLVGD